MTLRCLVFCWWLLLLLVGSGSALPNTVGAEGGVTVLANTRWTLVQMVVNRVEQPLGDSKTTLHFDAKDGMDGAAAVNDYYGQYAADSAGNLRWPTPTRATRFGSSGALLRLESTYLSTLSKVRRWEMLSAGRTLHLSTVDGTTVLTFSSATAPGTTAQ